MSQNLNGQTINYETFKSEYDSNPGLADIVARFNSQGIILKTKEKEMPTQGSQKTGKIDSMAKRAAAKNIKS